MSDFQVLPEFKGARNGSGCDNPDCEAKQRHIRVLSEHEADRMYAQKDDLEQWPYPPQATHACEKCGYCYQGIAGQVELTSRQTDTSNRPEVVIEDYDWEPASAYETPVRESIEALIQARPDDADVDEITEAVYRYVPGAGTEDAKDVLAELDVDMTVHSTSDFM